MTPLYNRNCEVHEPTTEGQLHIYDVLYQTQLRLHRGPVEAQLSLYCRLVQFAIAITKQVHVNAIAFQQHGQHKVAIATSLYRNCDRVNCPLGHKPIAIATG